MVAELGCDTGTVTYDTSYCGKVCMRTDVSAVICELPHLVLGSVELVWFISWPDSVKYIYKSGARFTDTVIRFILWYVLGPSQHKS